MSIWTPDPAHIHAIRATGFGDMGSLADRHSLGRFSLTQVVLDDGSIREVDVYTLVAARLSFVGGTGDAELSLYLDHREEGGLYDCKLATWPVTGASARSILHVPRDPEDLFGAYPLFAGDELVFIWTNPDPGTMRWVAEVMLAWAKLRPVGA